MSNDIMISIRVDGELNGMLTTSAQKDNRTKHSHILNVLRRYENGELTRNPFDIKLTPEEKYKIKKELGL